MKGPRSWLSNKAFDAGLTTPDKLAGHSFAITQYGSSFHYMIGRIAEAEHFDIKTVSLRPVQQVPNMLAAVQSGQVDATIAIASQARPLAASGQAHIIGWVGDIVPYQITALFTTDKMIAQHADLLHRFAQRLPEGRGGLSRGVPAARRRRQADRRCEDRCGDPADRQNTSSPAIRTHAKRSWPALAITMPAARWTWPT